MRNYVIKRLLLFIPTIAGVSVAVFVILRVVPGDIAATVLQAGDPEAVYTEQQRQEVVDLLGLDRPIYVQYMEWMWGIVRFDLGDSWVQRRPITTDLQRRFPVTVQLTIFAAFFVAILALPIGILAAVYQDKWPDYILQAV